ncbi:hydroxyacylglutathione hydrolase [Clostridium sp. CAG:678]|nr:hydroxyacylglutathione hydrolase [Clostridium sp. CAG:678]
MTQIKSITLGELGNNCYLITDQASGLSALVDCTDDSKEMRDFIGSAKLEYILLTHGHFDHIGGVAAISRDYGAKVVISAQDAAMLSSGKASLSAFFGIKQDKITPDLTVSEGSSLMLGETQIKVLATPGHTKGGVCYLLKDCIFTGDTLFFCSCGRTDFPGGSSKEIMQSLKRLATLEDSLKVYPGHDRTSTIAFEKANNPFMR